MMNKKAYNFINMSAMNDKWLLGFRVKIRFKIIINILAKKLDFRSDIYGPKSRSKIKGMEMSFLSLFLTFQMLLKHFINILEKKKL